MMAAGLAQAFRARFAPNQTTSLALFSSSGKLASSAAIRRA
jgi:hypothetical protein